MGSTSLARPLAALAGAAVALLLAVPVLANNRPAVSVTPSVSGTSAEFDVAVNRGAHQIDTCAYLLDDGAATDCGDPIDVAKKAAGYAINLAGLAGGSHAITVTIRLTDGGEATGSAGFEVVAGPRVFALAFSNVDGVAGYDPANDTLIAELVDTNGDDLVDAGDTVITDRYPLDFGATSFGTFGVTSHVVAHTTAATSTQASVTDDAGRSYIIEARDTAQRYLEATATGSTFLTSMFDSIGGADIIQAQTSAPSQPGTAVARQIGGSPADDAFVDVVMNMP